MYVKKVTSIALGLGMMVALSGCVYSRGVRYVDTRTHRPTRPEIHTFTVVKKEVHHERPRVENRETKREVHKETSHDGPRKAPGRREKDNAKRPAEVEKEKKGGRLPTTSGESRAVEQESKKKNKKNWITAKAVIRPDQVRNDNRKWMPDQARHDRGRPSARRPRALQKFGEGI